MTGRVQLVLTGLAIRQKAVRWINQAPPGTRLEFKAPSARPNRMIACGRC